MIQAFIEGPAGSGKTHDLIERTTRDGIAHLATRDSKVLALTFMNGARQRLTLRLSGVPGLRGRFSCLTFDAFARWLVHRRHSLLPHLAAEQDPGNLNVFDHTCRDAARLLEQPSVAEWVATSYPLVIVDEAQDLDSHRLRMLRGLATAAAVFAAADEYQNLNEHGDCAPVIGWLRTAPTLVQLTDIRRTNRDGLLRTASALRQGQDVFAGLEQFDGFTSGHRGVGIRIVQPVATRGPLAWTVADQLSQMSDRSVILTPDLQGAQVRNLLARLGERPFNRNTNAGTTFGPYPVTLERSEEEHSRALLDFLRNPDQIPIRDAIAAARAAPFEEGTQIAQRLERTRNVRGLQTVTRAELADVIDRVVRDSTRFGTGHSADRRAMTIQRAKNREFPDVLVLWPHSIANRSADHQRRLLYNAITRAQRHCSLVVFGQNRTNIPPFVPGV
jgi:superfamily I DNA/RNA helicase